MPVSATEWIASASIDDDPVIDEADELRDGDAEVGEEGGDDRPGPVCVPSPPAMGRGIVTTVRAMTTMGARSEARSDEQVRRDDRAHVFHSWSAQGLHRPARRSPAARDRWFWDDDGNRYLDFSSQLVNLNIGHQHPQGRRRHPGAGRPPVHRRPDLRQRRAERGRPPHRRAGARRPRQGVLHQRRRRGDRERRPDGARLHTGPAQGARRVPQLPRPTTGAAITLTGDPRRWADEPGAPRRRALLRARTRTARRSTPTTEAEEGERALRPPRGGRSRSKARSTVAAIVLETVVGTNGILVPPDGYLAGVRELCDRHGIVMICDEVMAGFGRCGEWFAVDRWGVVPDLIAFAKGVNSGYVPLGGVVMQRRDRRHLRRAPLPRRAHLLRAPAGLRRRGGVDPGHGGRGHHRPGAAPRRRGDRPRAPRPSPTRHPSVGEVRGLGVLLGHRARAGPGDPRACWSRTTRPAPAAAPMAELAAACKARRRVALHPLQPHARRAAVRHHRRGSCAKGSP